MDDGMEEVLPGIKIRTQGLTPVESGDSSKKPVTKKGKDMKSKEGAKEAKKPPKEKVKKPKKTGKAKKVTNVSLSDPEESQDLFREAYDDDVEVETPPKAGKESTKARLKELQAKRDDGTWIECADCQKWRYLEDVKDPQLGPRRCGRVP